MTKLLDVGSDAASGCAQYQPLYQPQPSAQTAHHRIMLTHVQDESVSELGRLLSEVLSTNMGRMILQAIFSKRI